MPVHLTDLAMLTSRDYPLEQLDAGEKVFLEGEPGGALHVVISGAIEIVTRGRHLERIGPGGIFGEVALIDDGPRSASALAAVDSEVVRVDRAAFLGLVRDHPDFALLVMQSMAQRLRRTNQR